MKTQTHLFLAIIKKAILFTLVLFSLSPFCPSVTASQSDIELFNYSFATWLGSGIYKVSDTDTRFAVIRLPFSFELKQPGQPDDPLKQKAGLNLIVPVIAAYQEERISDFNLGAVAVVPGLEAIIPVKERWILKPFVQLGLGGDSSTSSTQVIYGAGIKSRYSFSWENIDFDIGNAVVVAGNSTSEPEASNAFSMVEAGINARLPQKFSIMDMDFRPGVFYVASWLFNHAEFYNGILENSELKIINTLGLTITFDTPLPLWKINLETLGLEYRYGNAGFTGVGLNLGFPF